MKIQHGNSQIIVSDSQDQNCIIHNVSKKKQKYYKNNQIKTYKKVQRWPS